MCLILRPTYVWDSLGDRAQALHDDTLASFLTSDDLEALRRAEGNASLTQRQKSIEL